MNDVFNKDLFIVEGKIDWRLYALSLEAKIERHIVRQDALVQKKLDMDTLVSGNKQRRVLKEDEFVYYNNSIYQVGNLNPIE
jgi:hypothetical protein